MTRQHWLVLAAALVVAGPAASETAPSAVVFEEGAVAASLTGKPGDPVSGKKVMTTAALGNCVACHAIEAMPEVPFHGDIGPALDGAADRWSEAQLRGLIVNAKMTFDGTFMPAFYKTDGFIRLGNAYTGKAPESGTMPPILSAQQVEDVVAYLMTLKD